MEHKRNCDEITDRALMEGYVAGRLGEPDTEAFESHYLTGVVYCWGSNGDGQLGDGSTTDRLTPVRVVR